MRREQGQDARAQRRTGFARAEKKRQALLFGQGERIEEKSFFAGDPLAHAGESKGAVENAVRAMRSRGRRIARRPRPCLTISDPRG